MTESAVSAATRLLSERTVLATVSSCGKCGPSGWLEDENGKPVGRCPECHPGVAPPPGAVRTKATSPSLVRPRADGPRAGRKGRTDSPVAPVRPSWETSDRTIAWNAVDLLSADFPPPRWAVPGLVAEGVSVLAGPPKVGKSWLAMGLAVAVASGGKALGKIDVDAGPALYLALEDTGRRLQTRLGKVLAGARPPRDLTCVIECPTLPQGGGHQIATWLDKNPAARLVVIDVFAKLRGPVPSGASAYDADYRSVGQIKAIADGYGVPVVLVHHTRKAASDDYLAEVSGTNGIAGAADATLVLRRTRGKADGVLQVTGRDVDESEYAMKFESDLGCWLMVDQPVAELTLPDTRSTILAYLRTDPGQGPKKISDATGLAYELVKKTAKRMADDNQLHSDGRGRYYPATDEVSPLSRLSPSQPSTTAHGDDVPDAVSPHAHPDIERTPA